MLGQVAYLDRFTVGITDIRYPVTGGGTGNRNLRSGVLDLPVTLKSQRIQPHYEDRNRNNPENHSNWTYPEKLTKCRVVRLARFALDVFLSQVQ